MKGRMKHGGYRTSCTKYSKIWQICEYLEFLGPTRIHISVFPE